MKVRLNIRKSESRKNLPLILVIGLLACVFAILSVVRSRRAELRPWPAEKEQAAAEEAPAPSWHEFKLIIQPGSTLSDILPRFDVSPQEIHLIKEDVKPVYDLGRIKSGQELRVYTEPDGTLAALEYDIDRENYLLVQKRGQRYSGETVQILYDIRLGLIWGLIEDNPISAVTKQGEQPMLALMMSELFAWDIDFYTDLRQGDVFKILFEKKFSGDEFIGYGHILAAEFTNQGQKFQAFRYVYPDTEQWGYYSYNGDSLRREFLKSPINFARITSRFSYSRLHPIRKVFRPHMGVDYAARVGTEVQSTADGTVTYVGWNGASGRMVRIRHMNQYETMYLHLSRYGQGIRLGAKVKAGQVVGYVGSSGESTGPHLDYRIKYRGSYINPLAWKFKPVEPLRKEFLADYQVQAAAALWAFDAPLQAVESLTGTALFRPPGDGN